MNEPRHRDEYSSRQTEAAHRVLVDLGQVLASFQDCLVVVGGWVPDLLIPEAEEPHVGSIDVDLALDAERLSDGRYAELIQLLLGTRRYRQGDHSFRLSTRVDLHDGAPTVQVDLDLLAAQDADLEKHRPKLLAGFRVQRADGCDAAFRAPRPTSIRGKMINGAENTVSLRVAALPDFLVMKTYALAGRDKPKDAYDLCYCLDHCPGGMGESASVWRERRNDDQIVRTLGILREKFSSPTGYGPTQVAEFNQAADEEERAGQARRAFELVQRFLQLADLL